MFQVTINIAREDHLTLSKQCPLSMSFSAPCRDVAAALGDVVGGHDHQTNLLASLWTDEFQEFLGSNS